MNITKKLKLCLVLIIFISLLPGYVYAPPAPGGIVVIPISFSRAYLDVELVPSSSSGLTFDYESADEENPWVLAGQYIHIEFDTDYDDGYWGLRIITDNREDLESKYSGEVEPYSSEANTDYDGDGNEWYDEDDYYNYGGLICIKDTDGDDVPDTISDDFYFRAILAWQVYPEPTSVTAPTDESFDGDDGWMEEFFEEITDIYGNKPYKDYGDYNADWAYLGDKGDTQYAGDSVQWQEDLDGDGTIEDDEWVVNYNCIAHGGPGYAIRELTLHPDDGDRGISDLDSDDLDGDGYTTDDGWDIYVYIASRFWNTAYIDTGGSVYDIFSDNSVNFLLPAGTYETTIYIEIFHE